MALSITRHHKRGAYVLALIKNVIKKKKTIFMSNKRIKQASGAVWHRAIIMAAKRAKDVCLLQHESGQTSSIVAADSVSRHRWRQTCMT